MDGILYTFVLICVFSFKLTIIDLGESGIRLDDFLILIALIILLFTGDLRETRRSRPFMLYLVFVLLNFLSAAWNSLMGRVHPMLAFFFVIRPLQYMVFYYLGHVVARSGRRFARAMTWYLLLLAVTVPLQMLGIVPTFGAFSGITSRAVGNTNGPYELAVVAGFLICFLGYQFQKRIQGAIAFVLIVLSASRITFVAAVISLTRTLLKIRPQLRFALAITVLLLVCAVWLGAYPSLSGSTSVALFNRLSSAASTDFPNEVVEVYRSIPTYESYDEYVSGAYIEAIDNAQIIEGSEGEISGAIRLFRWSSLIKSALASPDSTIIGLGPSFGTAAVDGYFVRLFIESGILGLLSFLIFSIALLRGESSSSPFREYVFILLATCCFIDIGVSYKPMLLLWLWHGMNEFELQNAEVEGNIPFEAAVN